jgi:putative phage-type endonuclease
MRVDVYSDEESWLAARSGSLGASDAATVAGVSKWKSQFELWAEMTGKVEREPANLKMRLGHDLEPVVHREAEKEEDVFLWNPGDYTIVTEESYPKIHVTPDRLWYEKPGKAPPFDLSDVLDLPRDACSLVFDSIVSCDGPGEIKTVGVWSKDEWEDGKTPVHVVMQVQQQLLVMGKEEALVMCMVGLGDELYFRHLQAHPDLQNAILEASKVFLEAVESDIPPTVDDSDATRKVLAKVYPQEIEVVYLARDEEASELAYWVENRATGKRMAKEAKATITESENRIKAVMGEHNKIVIPDVAAFTWKTVNAKGYTVEPKSYRGFREVKLPRD